MHSHRSCLLFLLVAVLQPAAAQQISLSAITEINCAADFNSAVFLKRASPDGGCLLFFTDVSSEEKQAVVRLNGKLVILRRVPPLRPVQYQNYILHSDDKRVTVLLNASVFDSCSGESNCDGGTFRGTLVVRSAGRSKSYPVEFYRGG